MRLSATSSKATGARARPAAPGIHISDPKVTVLVTGRQGAEGATTYVDETGLAWSGAGAATLTSVGALFPPRSLAIPNVSDTTHWSMAGPQNEAFALGAGDFCVEVWATYSSDAGVLVCHGGESGQTGWRLSIQPEGNELYWYSDVAGYYPSGEPVPLNLGYYRAERIDGTVYLYAGTQIVNSFEDSTDYSYSPPITYLGRQNNLAARAASGIWGGVQVTVGGNRGGAGVNLSSIPTPYDLLVGV